MGEKLVGLRKIKDIEFVKEKIRNFGFLDFFDTFKKNSRTFWTYFRNFRD